MKAGFRKLLKVQRILSENFGSVKRFKGQNNTGEMQEHNKTRENDTVESNDYDSDHYSEVDVNEHV